jgi:hypothetical protein
MLFKENKLDRFVTYLALTKLFISNEHRQKLKKKWLTLSDEEKMPFQKKARDHIGKQQYMKECITDALRKDQGGNCSRSYNSTHPGNVLRG